MKKTRMLFATGLVVFALLSTGSLASNASAAPTLAERQNPALAVAKMPRAHAAAMFGTLIETELLSLELTGFDSVNVRVKEGTHETVASFFDVFYELSYGGEHFSGGARTGSFFDVFYDIGLQGQSSQTLGMRVLEICVTIFDVRICLIIDISASLSRGPGEGGIGGAIAGDSFFDVFISLDDMKSKARLLSHSMTSSFSNRILAVKGPAGETGWEAHSSSFFDVFTELSFDAAPRGNAQVSSFFDVFFDVFSRGFGPSDIGHSRISGSGKNHASYSLDEKTGQPTLVAHNEVAQMASFRSTRNIVHTKP